MTKIQYDVNDIRESLEFHLVLDLVRSNAIDLLYQIENMIDMVSQEALKFERCVDDLANNKLCRHLISPSLFKEVITKAEEVLPDGSNFACAYDINSCYEFAEARAMVHGEDIMVIFTVPYSTHNSQFELYHIKTYPIYDTESGKFQKICFL